MTTIPEGHIYGLDLSTQRIAVASIDLSTGSSWVQEVFIEQGTTNRSLAALKALQPAMREWEPGVAFVEDPALGVSAKSTIEQAMVSGVVQAMFGTRGFRHEMVNNNTWKKAVVGKGNAKKPEIAAFVEETMPEWAALVHEVEPRSKERRQDLFDAICILQYGITERLRFLQ